METQTWKAVCRKCNDNVYYYPMSFLNQKSLPVSMETRIVHIKCDNCEKTRDFEFPKDFNKVY